VHFASAHHPITARAFPQGPAMRSLTAMVAPAILFIAFFLALSAGQDEVVPEVEGLQARERAAGNVQGLHLDGPSQRGQAEDQTGFWQAIARRHFTWLIRKVSWAEPPTEEAVLLEEQPPASEGSSESISSIINDAASAGAAAAAKVAHRQSTPASIRKMLTEAEAAHTVAEAEAEAAHTVVVKAQEAAAKRGHSRVVPKRGHSRVTSQGRAAKQADAKMHKIKVKQADAQVLHKIKAASVNHAVSSTDRKFSKFLHKMHTGGTAKVLGASHKALASTEGQLHLSKAAHIYAHLEHTQGQLSKAIGRSAAKAQIATSTEKLPSRSIPLLRPHAVDVTSKMDITGEMSRIIRETDREIAKQDGIIHSRRRVQRHTLDKFKAPKIVVMPHSHKPRIVKKKKMKGTVPKASHTANNKTKVVTSGHKTSILKEEAVADMYSAFEAEFESVVSSFDHNGE